MPTGFTSAAWGSAAAVALAVHALTPIYVAEAVLDDVCCVREMAKPPAEPPPAADMSVFQEFIDTLDEQEPDRGGPETHRLKRQAPIRDSGARP
jgi:hypothetical protein